MKFLIIFLAIVFFVGCSSLVQDNFPPFSPTPVVNCVLIAGKPIGLHLSYTGSLDSNRIAPIENAEVRLLIEGIFNGFLTHVEDGVYASDLIAEPLKAYDIEVLIPDLEPILLTQEVPTPIQVIELKHFPRAQKNEEGIILPAVEFSFANDPSESRYYEIIIHLIRNQDSKNPELVGAASLADITDPILKSEGLPLALFSNKRIDAEEYRMTINYTTGSFGSTNGGPQEAILYPLIVEFRSVSLDYYQYVRQRHLYEQGRYPEFGGGAITAFQLYSNVENGYGIIAGYSTIKSDTIFPYQP